MKIVMSILMILLLGAFFIISQNNLALKNSENVDRFVSNYASWVGDVVKNIGSLTGYIVKLEWLPESEPETAG